MLKAQSLKSFDDLVMWRRYSGRPPLCYLRVRFRFYEKGMHGGLRSVTIVTNFCAKNITGVIAHGVRTEVQDTRGGDRTTPVLLRNQESSAVLPIRPLRIIGGLPRVFPVLYDSAMWPPLRGRLTGSALSLTSRRWGRTGAVCLAAGTLSRCATSPNR